MMRPIVPFWPLRLAILSPIAGRRSSLTLIFAKRNPSSPSVMKDLSTNPSCPFLGNTEASLAFSESAESDVTLPINTILSSNGVFSLISPNLSK